jgi:hypothetical protein
MHWVSLISDIGLQDGLGVDDVFWFVCGLAATMTALGVIFRPVVRRSQAFFAWWEKFARDWDGEESAPGRDRMPGVMERLNNIDGELKRNGGSSLKDQVCQMRTQIDVIEERQREIAIALGEHARTLDSHLTGPGRNTV